MGVGGVCVCVGGGGSLVYIGCRLGDMYYVHVFGDNNNRDLRQLTAIRPI